MTIFWTVLLVALIILEASTAQFVCIWFAGGAFVSLICSMFDLEPWIQICVFLAVTLILLISTRKIVRKLKSSSNEKTNVDALIGQSAIVTEKISNIAGEGAVKLGGIVWSARSDNSDEIDIGEIVTVIRIDGVKLIVNKKAG